MGFIKLTTQVINTIQLSLSFFVLFAADFTITGLQKLINVSINEDNPDYDVDGYISMGLIYLFFGIFLLTGPSIISFVGPRVAMVIGSSMMTMFFFLFYFEITWLTYLGVFLSGSGGSLLWVGEGNYMVLNSETDTIPFHVSLFWAIFATSMIPCNIYSAVSFAGKSRIDRDTRNQLIFVASALGAISVAMLVFLRRPRGKMMLPVVTSPLVAMKTTFSLFFSREFMTLLSTFIYMGFQQSFGWGVYVSTLAFTQRFGTFATQLAPIAAIVYGTGDALGAFMLVIAPKMEYHFTRRYVFWVSYVLQSLAAIGIFINIPAQAVFGYTNESSYVETPMVWLALVSSFAIGMSDGFYNTQIYPLLANMYPEYGAQTAALYKFTKSLSVAAFFFASTVLNLHIQLLVMVILGFIGSICFSIVDKRVYKMVVDRERKL
uniref:UNC93-like protein MFSD11 n=1 Tax=Lygus hesperus TaxID=30085 RepID=A0A0A9XRW2_LYGHE